MYSIISFILFTAVFCYARMLDQKRSTIQCRYNGKEYYRDSKIVCAFIKQFYWNKTGEYSVELQIESECSCVELPIKKEYLQKIIAKGIGGNVFLLSAQTPSQKTIVQFFPLSFIDGQEKMETKSDIKTMNEEQIKIADNITRKVYAAAYFALGMAFFLSVELPVISCVLSVISAYLFTSYIPFKNWTKEVHADVVKNNDSSLSEFSQEKKIEDEKKQAGYSEMSPLEKEIFDIRQRTIAQKKIQKESAPVQDESENAAVNNKKSSTTTQENLKIEQKEDVLSEKDTRCCKECGCVVPNDAVFCCYCGQSFSVDKQENFSAVVSPTNENVSVSKQQSEPQNSSSVSENNDISQEAVNETKKEAEKDKDNCETGNETNTQKDCPKQKVAQRQNGQSVKTNNTNQSVPNEQPQKQRDIIPKVDATNQSQDSVNSSGTHKKSTGQKKNKKDSHETENKKESSNSSKTTTKDKENHNGNNNPNKTPESSTVSQKTTKSEKRGNRVDPKESSEFADLFGDLL